MTPRLRPIQDKAQCQRSRRTAGSNAPWPKPSVLTHSPPENGGGLLPNDGLHFTLSKPAYPFHGSQCDEMQGYRISKPMPVRESLRFFCAAVALGKPGCIVTVDERVAAAPVRHEIDSHAGVSEPPAPADRAIRPEEPRVIAGRGGEMNSRPPVPHATFQCTLTD